ncbi:MAG: nucleotide pyrophosphohydrolase [Spirochaetales bacterium]|nr:nucleotide pyrophosphohydrolase [Spirochaetales bacterium]
MDIDAVQQKIRTFVAERDWEKYHTPKNVAIALSVEVSELLEIFQWMTDEQAASIQDGSITLKKINEEFADSMIYLLRFADLLNIDIDSAIRDKLKKNEEKYPAESARGEFVKYTDR